MRTVIALLLLCLVAAPVADQPARQVAITIDDLPPGGDRGPRDLAGFVNAGRVESLGSQGSALSDEAYGMRDGYVGRGGFSWIHRWSMTKGIKPKGEPEPAAWVRSHCASIMDPLWQPRQFPSRMFRRPWLIDSRRVRRDTIGRCRANSWRSSMSPRAS